MKSITVFCGSSYDSNPAYRRHAKDLGTYMAQHQISLVYGGAKVGLMGIIADTVLSHNGSVIGVIPHFLQTKEIAHQNLTELIMVDSMHQRKHKMSKLCDGFIAMPGGFGTLEELFEVLTWAQLGLHSKPIGLLNIDGYYEDLTNMIDKMVNQKFLNPLNRDMLIIDDNVEYLITSMMAYKAPDIPKWLKKDQV